MRTEKAFNPKSVRWIIVTPYTGDKHPQGWYCQGGHPTKAAAQLSADKWHKGAEILDGENLPVDRLPIL